WRSSMLACGKIAAKSLTPGLSAGISRADETVLESRLKSNSVMRNILLQTERLFGPAFKSLQLSASQRKAELFVAHAQTLSRHFHDDLCRALKRSLVAD